MLENLYDIKDIIAVRFSSNYQDYLDKEVIKNSDGTYIEIYEDAILGVLLYERVVKSDKEDYPGFIEEVRDIELEGLTPLEKEKGIVGSFKLFSNFQLINDVSYAKTKRLSMRRVG